MAVYKTVVQIEDDGSICLMDTIEYEGKLWFVTGWLEGPTKGTEWPARIICLDGLPTQKPGPYGADFLLNIPLPRDVLDGRKIPQGLVVIDRPDIILNVDTKH